MIPDESKPRPAMVTLVLTGVLLLTVGGAWLMVRFYYSPSREGTLILREMRKQGLGKLWPGKRSVARFWQKDVGGRVERRLTISRGAADGSISGKESMRVESGSFRQIGDVESSWEVSDNLSEANYLAVYKTRGVFVRIELDRDRVRFRGSGMKEAVPVDLPGNYIPEGLEWLVVRQVAWSGKKAAFREIDDLLSLEGKTIEFVRMELTPVSRQVVRCRIDWGGGHEDMTYHLGAGGEVERIDYEDGAVLSPLPTGTATPPEKPAETEESPSEMAEDDPLEMAP